MRENVSPEIISKKFPLSEPGLLQEIMDTGRFYTSETNEVLFRPGEVITHVPLVLFGRIRLFREDPGGKEVFLYSIQAGETCAVALGCCFHTTGEIRAVAEEDTELIFVPFAKVEEWLVKYQSWRAYVLNTFQKRYSELLHVIDMIAFGQLDQRLVYFLRQTSTNKHTSMIRITHQEIAESLGSSREVITRILKQLENKGKVKTGRNQLELLPSLFEE